MTITAEHARALKSGITPGPWKTADAIGTGGTLCYENVKSEVGVIIANVWHSDDYDFMPDRRTRGYNSAAIAILPDALDTIIAQAARIEALRNICTALCDGWTSYETSGDTNTCWLTVSAMPASVERARTALVDGGAR